MIKINEKQEIMMRSISLWMAIGLILISQSFLVAHGGDFHSLKELREHINEHILELENYIEGKTLNTRRIQHVYYEIRLHVRGYQKFSIDMKSDREFNEITERFNQLCPKLGIAAFERNLFQTLNSYKEMRFLLQS